MPQPANQSKPQSAEFRLSPRISLPDDLDPRTFQDPNFAEIVVRYIAQRVEINFMLAQELLGVKAPSQSDVGEECVKQGVTDYTSAATTGAHSSSSIATASVAFAAFATDTTGAGAALEW